MIHVRKKIVARMITKILLNPEIGVIAVFIEPVFIGKNSTKIQETITIIKRLFSACWFCNSLEKSAENKKQKNEISLHAKQVFPMRITRVE